MDRLVDSGASGAGLSVVRAGARRRRVLQDVVRVGLDRWDSQGPYRRGMDRQVRHGAGRSGLGRLRPALGHDGTDHLGRAGLDRRVPGRAGLDRRVPGRAGLDRRVPGCAGPGLSSGRVVWAAEAAVLVALGAGLAQLLWRADDPSARSSNSGDDGTPRLRGRSPG